MSEKIKEISLTIQKIDVVDNHEQKPIRPVFWNWKPQPEITAFELSLCIPYIIGFTIGSVTPEMIKYLEENNILKHFEIKYEDNQG